MNIAAAAFGVTNHLSPAQECARALVIAVYLLVLVRLGGRRMFGRWSVIDIIFPVIIGSSLSRALTGNAPFAGTLLAAAMLTALHWVFVQVAARSASLSHLLEGRAVTLAEDGRPLPAAMRTHGISMFDVEEALRKRNVESLERARKIVLEPSGDINVLD